MTALQPAEVTLDLIRDAATVIKPYAVRTPLLPSPWSGLWLKPESLQPVGSFKIRGAVTAIARLGAERRAEGVIAHSSGNHAQAVAFAARLFGIDAHIVIPDNAPAAKIEATRAFGATVELVPLAERFRRADQLARETGRPLIPPYDHVDVISGQGTIGLEIAADDPAVDVVLVPVSGGGLLSGIAVALAALLPRTKVIGVEPELAGDAAASLRSGKRQVWPAELTSRTIADGLRTPSLGVLPWHHISHLVHDIVTVTEAQIMDAAAQLMQRTRLIVEPSGAVATAAFLHLSLPPGRTVAVISGGNLDRGLAAALLA